jgi:hypothetical protein
MKAQDSYLPLLLDQGRLPRLTHQGQRVLNCLLRPRKATKEVVAKNELSMKGSDLRGQDTT